MPSNRLIDLSDHRISLIVMAYYFSTVQTPEKYVWSTNSKINFKIVICFLLLPRGSQYAKHPHHTVEPEIAPMVYAYTVGPVSEFSKNLQVRLETVNYKWPLYFLSYYYDSCRRTLLNRFSVS